MKSVLGYNLHLFDLHYGTVGEVGNGLTGQVAQEGNIGSEGTDVESHRIGLQVIVVTFQADGPRLAVIELILYQLALHEGHRYIAYIVDTEEVFLHLGRGWQIPSNVEVSGERKTAGASLLDLKLRSDGFDGGSLGLETLSAGIDDVIDRVATQTEQVGSILTRQYGGIGYEQTCCRVSVVTLTVLPVAVFRAKVLLNPAMGLYNAFPLTVALSKRYSVAIPSGAKKK